MEIIKLIAILSFVQSVTSNLSKCCSLNSELSVNSTDVLNFSRENVTCKSSITGTLAITYTGYLSIGLPNCTSFQLVNAYDRSVKVFCVDRVQEYNDVFGVSCSNSAIDENFFQLPSITSFRKCCPLNRKYDDKKQFCWSPLSENDAGASNNLAKIVLKQSNLFVNVTVGVPFCHVNNVLLDTILSSEQVSYSRDSIRINDAGPFSYDEYCVDIVDDRFEYVVVRSCRDYSIECKNKNRTCVRKCCGSGYEFNEKYKCVSSQRPLSLTFQKLLSRDEKNHLTFSKSNEVIKPAYLQGDICRKYRLDDNVENDKHVLTTDGMVYKFYTEEIFDVNEYCVENEKRNNKTNTYICFPQKLNKFINVKRKLTTIGSAISAVFLSLTFAIYLILPSLRNQHGKLIMCFLVTSAWSYTTVVLQNILPFEKLPKEFCPISGYVLLFTFLSSFSWLNIISYDIWSTFKGVQSTFFRRSKRYKKFSLCCLIGWGCPLVWTGMAILCQYTSIIDQFSKLKPDVGQNICFFSNYGKSMVIFFAIPVSTMISFNLIFFVLTVKYCSNIRSALKISNKNYSLQKYHSDKNEFLINIKLFIVMGINWIMEILSLFFRPQSQIFFIVSDVLDALSGFFIFCIFIIKRKILYDLKIKLRSRDQSRQIFERATGFTTSTTSSTIPNPINFIEVSAVSRK